MSTTRVMTSSRKMAPADRGSVERRWRFDGDFLIALELFLAVLIVEALIILHAGLSSADVGALYISVT